MESKLYARHIDTCKYVNNVFGVPICRLNCAPCEHVDPKNCEAIEEMPENTGELKGGSDD